MAYQTTQQTQDTVQMQQMQQTQEQVSHLPFSYQSSSILNQRLDRIRGVQQEQVSGSPAAFQSSSMLTQHADHNSGISQVQVPQVPSSFQSSNSLLPRLEYNQATSQVQLTQPLGTFQSSSSHAQHPQEQRDHREHLDQREHRDHRGHMDQQRDHRGHMDQQRDHRGHMDQREHMNQGISNISTGIPVYASDGCGPSAAPCGRNQGPAFASNCAPEPTSLGCCGAGCGCGRCGGCFGSLTKCCSGLLMTFLGLLGIIWIGLAISEIVIGSVYLGECPAQRYIPIYLIVSGTTLLAMIILSFFAGFKCGRFLIAFVTILGLFWFAWLIAGSVWTFPLYPNYQAIDCRNVVYLFTFAILIIQWILVGFSLPAILAKVMTLITSFAGSCCSICSSCSSCSLCSKCCCCCSSCAKCFRCLSCCPCGTK